MEALACATFSGPSVLPGVRTWPTLPSAHRGPERGLLHRCSGTLGSVVQCPALGPQTHSAYAPLSLEQQMDCGLYSFACHLESLGGAFKNY